METETQNYSPGPNAEDITPDKSKGVLKEIITPGVGEDTPCKGNKVSVHYTGKLLDGTKFDSSVDRGEFFEFNLGKGEVIKAWDVGVATMKKGEKCILYCHPDYAYGKKGSPPKIPENATLVFEVELFDWQMEDLSPENDKSILRSLIVEGEGYATPGDGSNVEVKLVGKYDGKIFEDREVKFEIGAGIDVNVVEGIEIALQKFKKGEQSRLILSPKFAFGAEEKKDFGIPPNATVEYEVTLQNFEKEKESWNMTSEEKLEQSEIVKNKGTNYFKAGKYEMATKQYDKIISYLQHESELEGEQLQKKNSLLVAGYLNLAACYLKLENHSKVKENCEKALELDSKNEKGHFRIGQAHLALNDFELAKDSFEKALESDPSNKAAQKSILICKERIRKQLQKEKQMYQTMFKKMAQEKDLEEEPSKTSNPENGLAEKIESEETVQV
ncbi:peptidyl-prolyl cis-trans isomerase FKBP4 [Parasteatoda tepidariorum]|uniref:peptidyl-prolyl cis-trans isomerase FKBP4 n=1 Tax=Parasteatoda tepidariorum TaxID=114398 RepID=UPI00077FD7D9|nr:peptidyl-prolyl cis-trans isomerase FKBP4 [Parasteatoda tepidariorum]